MAIPGLDEKDLPDLRLRMAEFMQHHGTAWMPYMFQSLAPEDEHDELPTAEEIRALARSGRAGLRDAVLFYVDDDLADIALHSGVPIEAGFMPYDLPAKQGLVYYDHHCASHADDVAEVTVGNKCGMVAAWNVHEPTEERPNGHVDLFVYLHRDEFRQAMEHKFGVGVLGEMYDRLQPEYVLVDVMSLIFAPVGGELQYWASTEEQQIYLRMLVATCHLMRQQLAETDVTPPTRSVRRRHERAGLEPPEIRVIRLRRTQRKETTGESRREWRHRWIVRGHWRNQWYPSIQAHRPKWIEGYPKGPEGAPLLGGDKVYVVKDD